MGKSKKQDLTPGTMVRVLTDGYPWPIPTDGTLKDEKDHIVTDYSKGHVAWRN